jgi:hypothetical protein
MRRDAALCWEIRRARLTPLKDELIKRRPLIDRDAAAAACDWVTRADEQIFEGSSWRRHLRRDFCPCGGFLSLSAEYVRRRRHARAQINPQKSGDGDRETTPYSSFR